MRERYPEAENPRVGVEIKEIGEKDINVILLENFVSHSSSILFLGYFMYEYRFVGSKGSKPRSKDLCSRIRKFVYESKLNLAIIKTP